MANEPMLTPRQIEEHRQRVVDALTQHFAQDDLTMDDLERRLSLVYAAQTPSALTAVLEGLPALGPEPSSSVQPAASAQGSPMVTPAEGYGWRTLVALMSGITRKGAWTAPRRLHAIAFMGGIELDFRSARLTHPVTEINIVAIMGGVVITVPTGVRVESDGFAIMGGFDDAPNALVPADPNAPVIRIRGLAIMGGVEVRVVDPRAQLLDSGQPVR
jgi:hypothetical protein